MIFTPDVLLGLHCCPDLYPFCFPQSGNWSTFVELTSIRQGPWHFFMMSLSFIFTTRENYINYNRTFCSKLFVVVVFL